MTQFDGLWRNPAFLRFWAADAVSVFGSLITRIALPFTAILMLDASAFEMSLLVLADLVPSCVIGLPVAVTPEGGNSLPQVTGTIMPRATKAADNVGCEPPQPLFEGSHLQSSSQFLIGHVQITLRLLLRQAGQGA
jgi:hypothetical protein